MVVIVVAMPMTKHKQEPEAGLMEVGPTVGLKPRT